MKKKKEKKMILQKRKEDIHKRKWEHEDKKGS